MKSILSILFYVLTVFKLSAQFKEQPVRLLEKYHGAKYMTMKDSIITEDNAIIEVEELSIVFYKLKVDSANCKVRLAGKVSSASVETPPFTGIFGVGIFKAIRNQKKLTEVVDLGKTSYDKSNFNNNGFFDIWFTIGKNESLFFYTSGYFLEEYKLSVLLKKELHIKCNEKKTQ